MTATAIDQARFEALQGKVMGDIGGAIGLLMAYIGDQTGVYEALEEHGPCDHESLAEHTGLNARYLREWLSANAAFGYVVDGLDVLQELSGDDGIVRARVIEGAENLLPHG
mgnify:CR=1 FL=1